jgi:hypothetical protein
MIRIKLKKIIAIIKTGITFVASYKQLVLVAPPFSKGGFFYASSY